ncbi:MAG: DsbA family protein [Nitriliruptoraceae bacterium]
MTLAFGVTFDYLCPWARNVHDHVITALRGGAEWQVDFVPYSLAQGHVSDDETPIWDRPEPFRESGILALATGLYVRDHLPEQFLDVHEALFAVRHELGLDIKDPQSIAKQLSTLGLDGESIVANASTPAMVEQLAREHQAAVNDHDVWGVPTLIGASRSVFVRVMDRPNGDAETARQRIEHLIELVNSHMVLHEFKETVLAK